MRAPGRFGRDAHHLGVADHLVRDQITLADPAFLGGQQQCPRRVVDTDRFELDLVHHERQLSERGTGDERAVGVMPQSPAPYVVDTHIATAGKP